MGYTNIGEVLYNPIRQFSLEEKQKAISLVINYLWCRWEQHAEKMLKSGSIDSLYALTLQRQQIVEDLLKHEAGPYGTA